MKRHFPNSVHCTHPDPLRGSSLELSNCSDQRKASGSAPWNGTPRTSARVQVEALARTSKHCRHCICGHADRAVLLQFKSYSTLSLVVGILEIPITSAVVSPYCHTKATVSVHCLLQHSSLSVIQEGPVLSPVDLSTSNIREPVEGSCLALMQNLSAQFARGGQ